MKKVTFKNMSIVSLCLLGVTALTSAFAPSSKDNDENANFAAGKLVLSTGGDSQTAVPGVGNGSYTVTATPTVAGSATGAATNTVGIGNNTGLGTTIGG